jgi:insertion element IS1 protein InsB
MKTIPAILFGSKENKQWAWIAIDVTTKQIVAFYVGDRSASSAQELWRRIPTTYRACATFYTDGLAAYKTVVSSERHKVRAKKRGNTNVIITGMLLGLAIQHYICNTTQLLI